MAQLINHSLHQPAEFRSAFGGLWTDRSDAKEKLEQLRPSLDETAYSQLAFWLEHGYVIIESAVDPSLCGALAEELRDLYHNGSDVHIVQDPYEGGSGRNLVRPGTAADKMRIVDMYVHSRLAEATLLTAPITDFLRLIFAEDPLLFQGLTFEKGSQQGLHQDTAYVVVDRPMELAAAWIALEDVRPGSGELMYLDGSHRMPEWAFGGSSKHFDSAIHSQEEHSAWCRHLIERGEELGMSQQVFLPKQGDALIWSADLVHGGSPQEDPSLSRRSIVGHYCPASANPHYFSFTPEACKVARHGAFIASAYFPLDQGDSPAIQPRSLRRRLMGRAQGLLSRFVS